MSLSTVMAGLDPVIHVLAYNEQGKTWMAGTSPAMTSYVVGSFISDIAMNDSQSLAKIKGTIVLCGAGKMGGAMLSGWLAQGLDARSVGVIEPHPSDEISALVTKGVRLNPTPKQVGAVATLVVALKPQMFREAGPTLKQFAGSSTLVVSIMAGTTIASIEEVCGGSVVRAMPNTPAAIGRGITVAVTAKNVSAEQRAIADALLRATGSVEWINDENLMDAVTAVSGSGPAYIFLLAEELARAGVEAGLPPELATKLARETVAGSGELLHRSELPSATLRQNVTSPGGTTAAALEVLMGPDGMQSLLTRAVAAATKRSKELAK
jgi:pyrroline-5-carboxylate reductase